MSIRKILEDARRYDDVLRILKEIVKNVNATGVYVIDGHKVHGKDIENEAMALSGLLNYYKLEDSLKNLHLFVNQEVSTLLNNYAIDISHNNEPNPTMDDVIKPYLILRSIIDNIVHGFGFDDFAIPEGWKKNTDLCEKKEEEEMDLRNDLINFANDVDDANADMAADKFTYLLHEYNYEPADTSDFPELREEYVICRDIERGQTIKLLLAERETFFILALQDTVKYKNSCCYSREVFYIYK